MSRKSSDDFDTLEFDAIRPDNPKYQQYFQSDLDPEDLSGFEDSPAPYNPPVDDDDFYDFDDDYYPAKDSEISKEITSSGLVAIAVVFAAIIIAVVAVMVAIIFGKNESNPSAIKPVTTSATTSIITTEATSYATEAAETSTEPEETTTETEATTSTEATTTEAATTEVTTTTQTETQPTETPEPTAPTLPPEPETPSTPLQTEASPTQSAPAETPGYEQETNFDWDPEIGGIQYVE